MQQEYVILELTVQSHPGVMSHICGLFARRSFNVEGILCLPQRDGEQSRIWLQVTKDCRLEQVVRQIDKLEDVVRVSRYETDPCVFNKLRSLFQG
ncbi:acetolactate synthase small subunit [Natronospirillum operosum]|uniref:Acetolactate synthase small subunit n=1 Tax=Natronospirillum operosum TaxID=2759953 RepID=A0A4Z0WEJ0_9GAMM|nr:acetolactate synthase small subunit [Natronospirillum operosum]TGG93351.1 acetolactate synthase small subunit [Natronospirillum operosum]